MDVERNIGSLAGAQGATRARRTGFSDADRLIVRIAATQNGRVARWQLLAAGLTRKVIAHRVRSGLLIPQHNGVYAIGHRDTGDLGTWSAAVLLGGPDSALWRRSAADLLKMIPGPGSFSEVVSPRRHRRHSLVRWCRAQLPPDELEVVAGVPATTPHRTLIDLASSASESQLESAVFRMEKEGLTDPVPLPVLLDRHAGARGMAALRRVLALHEGSIDIASEFELRFRAFAAKYKLPPSKRNHRIELPDRTIHVDRVWERERLGLELDSKRDHLDPGAFEEDRLRDAALAAAGWVVIRVTWRRLHREPEALARQILAILRARGT